MGLGKPVPRVYIVDVGLSTVLKARAMADLTVRNVSREMVDALKRRAADNGRSVEAEHREVLRSALLGENQDFAARARALRQRLRSSVDSAEAIRAARDGAS